MGRHGTKQKGQFNVQPGMVFTMPNMTNILPNGYDIGANEHPWLIVNTHDDYVEIVMCSTLYSNQENKHRMNSLQYENVTDITNACPPMDPPYKKTSKVSLDTFAILPKKELFSNYIQIWNETTSTRNFTTEKEKALCLNQKDLSNIRKEILQYITNHPELNYDPCQCEDAEENLYNLKNNYPVPKGFTKESYKQQFGWHHLPKANPYAIYPFEDQMYDYEKKDPELVKIACQKKAKIQTSKQQTKHHHTTHSKKDNKQLDKETLRLPLAEKARIEEKEKNKTFIETARYKEFRKNVTNASENNPNNEYDGHNGPR